MQAVEALLSLAVQAVNAGQPERAWLLCERALAELAADPGIHQLMALLCLQQGRAVQASQHANLSLALRPDHLPTLMLQADAARAADQTAVVLQALERIVVIDPGRIEAWFQLSLLRQDNLDFVGAEQALRRVLLLDPARVDACVNLAIVLQAMGRLPEALAHYGKAYRLDASSFGRIAHALAAASSGRVWLSLEDLRHSLLAASAPGLPTLP